MLYTEKSELVAQRAIEVLEASKIMEIWKSAGADVRLVGSLRMGLIARHRDIDLHVYSTGIDELGSFSIASAMARDTRVIELKCINGLHTDERCMAWHVKYRMGDDEIWQIDIIHIEKCSSYDGYFEEMADRIKALLTPELRELILRLKFETPENEEIHGVEYYEAVLSDGIDNLCDLRDWIKIHRAKAPYYWMPKRLSKS